eukprot:7324303-Alexandrium_andersonii.AAC.1
MSASLVGSEMCIRDRNLTCAMLCFRTVLCNLLRVIRSTSGRIFRGAAAVSYTHLTLPTICSV